MTWQQLVIIAVVLGTVLYILSILRINETFKQIASIIVIAVFAILALRFLFTFI